MKPLAAFYSVLCLSACALLGRTSSSPVEGEQVYRDNCRRCHIAIHTFSPRMTATVAHHMQVRATLTRDEEAAVLRYLLETSPTKNVAPPRVPAGERTNR